MHAHRRRHSAPRRPARRLDPLGVRVWALTGSFTRSGLGKLKSSALQVAVRGRNEPRQDARTTLVAGPAGARNNLRVQRQWRFRRQRDFWLALASAPEKRPIISCDGSKRGAKGRSIPIQRRRRPLNHDRPEARFHAVSDQIGATRSTPRSASCAGSAATRRSSLRTPGRRTFRSIDHRPYGVKDRDAPPSLRKQKETCEIRAR